MSSPEVDIQAGEQTENLENRFEKHLKDPSKQIMKMQPVKLLGSIRVDTRSQAMKLEKKMKAFKRRDRILSYFRKYGGCSSVG